MAHLQAHTVQNLREAHRDTTTLYWGVLGSLLLAALVGFIATIIGSCDIGRIRLPHEWMETKHHPQSIADVMWSIFLLSGVFMVLLQNVGVKTSLGYLGYGLSILVGDFLVNIFSLLTFLWCIVGKLLLFVVWMFFSLLPVGSIGGAIFCLLFVGGMFAALVAMYIYGEDEALNSQIAVVGIFGVVFQIVALPLLAYPTDLTTKQLDILSCHTGILIPIFSLLLVGVWLIGWIFYGLFLACFIMPVGFCIWFSYESGLAFLYVVLIVIGWPMFCIRKLLAPAQVPHTA